MKVAIFTGTDEIIVLAIKGRGKSTDNVDGYSEWFGEGNRDPRDYTITMGHVGADRAIHIMVNLKEDCWGLNIEDWFYDADEEANAAFEDNEELDVKLEKQQLTERLIEISKDDPNIFEELKKRLEEPIVD